MGKKKVKCRIDIANRVLTLPLIPRVLVIIFVPWLALYLARHQLWLACLVLRNEARRKGPGVGREDTTLLRWADELEYEGSMRPPPWNPHYEEHQSPRTNQGSGHEESGRQSDSGCPRKEAEAEG